MIYKIILIASDTRLSIVHLEQAEAFLETQSVAFDEARWHDPHSVAALAISNNLSLDQMQKLRSIFTGDKIDVLCVKDSGAAKKLLLADMDATIVTTETLDELADRAGIKDRIAAITARAMNGELDFHAALRERVGLLKSLPVSALYKTLEETDLCEGAGELIAAMRSAGAVCVLVSGGFTFFTEAVAARAGFHHHHGNTLDHDDHVLHGTVSGAILDKDAKLAFLKSYAAELGVDLSETCAIGDGANDLPMLHAAGIGIGYRPKPIVEAELPNVLKYASLECLKYVFAGNTL